mgnify:FL=1
MQAWIETLLVNLGYILMIEPTGVHFYILSGVAAGSFLIFGKLIAAYLVGSEKGFLLVFIGMLIPLILIVAGLTLADLYLVHHIKNDTWQLVVKISTGTALFLFIGVYLAKLFFSIEWGKSLAAIILTYGITFAGLFLTKSGIEAFSFGASVVDKYEENRAKE